MRKALIGALLCVPTLYTYAQPGTPTILGPTTDSLMTSCGVNLDWTQEFGAITYEVQYGTDRNLIAPQTVSTSASSNVVTDLFFTQQYFWKVRSFDGSQYSPWTPIDSFVTMNGPQFQATAPVSNKQIEKVYFYPVPPGQNPPKDRIYTLYDTLKWKHICYLYQVQVDTTRDFSSLANKTYHTSSGQLEVKGLYYGTKHYWRHRALNAVDTSTWSTVDSLRVLRAPIIIHPSDGVVNYPTANMVDSNLMFRIKPIEGSMFYEFQLDTSASFNSLDFQTMLHDSLPMKDVLFNPFRKIRSKRFYPAAPLRFGQKYFYRFRARSLTHVSYWNTRTFTTIDTVHLMGPLQGDTVATTMPKLEWNRMKDISYYIIEYDTSAVFSNPRSYDIYPNGPNTLKHTPFIPLKHGVEHHWRVAAVNPLDTSSWNTKSFVVSPTASVERVTPSMGVQVFPNPCQSNLTVMVNGVDEVEYELRSLDGALLLRDRVIGTGGVCRGELGIRAVAAGVYLLRIKSDKGLVNEKVVVRR